MNKEERLLNKIFGGEPKLWRGKHEIGWCDHCEVIIAKFACCGATSCNCAGCDQCIEDSRAFSALHNQPRYHMREDEHLAVERFFRLRHFIVKCLEGGLDQLSWEHVYREGWASEHDQSLFPELQKLHEELKLW